MSDPKNGIVVDTDGVWLVNGTAFDQVDPTTGVRMRAGTPTKVKRSDWLESQSEIIKFVDQADKEAEDARKAKAQAAADTAKLAAEAAEREAESQRQREADALKDAGKSPETVKPAGKDAK